jgi:hypothetical protein
MKPLLLLFIALTFFGLHEVFAQTANTRTDDNDFAPGLFIVIIIFFSVMAGAMLAGTLAAGLVLFFLFGVVSAGIFSTAVMVGLYKRSVSAGFKTLVLLISTLGGIILGIGGLYLVDILFHLHLSHSVIAWSGLIGGLVGGILLGLALFALIRLFLEYTKRKLSI